MTINLSDLQRTLNLVCAKNRFDSRLPDFFLMSDDERLPDPLQSVANMAQGSAIILRHRQSTERNRLAFALQPVCRRRNVLLIIANDISLAERCGADGIHCSQEMIKHNATRLQSRIGQTGRGGGRPWLVSGAAHSLNAALLVQKAGADVILLSPIFSTLSHPGTATLGTLRMAAIIRHLETPVYGLGGITGPRLKRLKNAGLTGIAGIGYLAKCLNKP